MHVAHDAEKLLPWLRNELGWSAPRFAGTLSGGNSNLTWKFVAGQQSCVVRTAPAEGISPSAHRGIEREYRVLSAVAGRLRAPRVLGWCAGDACLGRPFLVLECIDGVAISDALPAAYAERDDAVDRLGAELMDALADIHGIPADTPGLDGLGRADNFLERQIKRWLEVRKRASVRELPALPALGRWLLDNEPPATRACLIHGDYHLDNTLASCVAPEILAVIDWELATVGDPYTDLGLALMLWGNERRAQPPAFEHLQAVSRRPGAVDRRALAQRWAARTGLGLEHLDYYMVYAFWRLAAIVEGAYCLYVQGKVNSDYARKLEYDVPALLDEARQAAAGGW